jgi:predicted DNA-binding protein
MKNNETLYAVSARLPTATYEKMNKLVELTKKPISTLVHDAIVEYMDLVYNINHTPSKSLQIDRFAVNIESE